MKLVDMVSSSSFLRRSLGFSRKVPRFEALVVSSRDEMTVVEIKRVTVVETVKWAIE
jgi:hypothetical protein